MEKNMIKVSNLADVKQLLMYFKDDLKSLRKNRVDIDIFAEKITEFANVYEYNDDAIKGMAVFYSNDALSRSAFLSMIAVKEPYRREHIGSKMLAFAEAVSARDGMDMMRLEVDKSNLSALTFYRKYGYEIFDQTDTSYLMSKTINNKSE